MAESLWPYFVSREVSDTWKFKDVIFSLEGEIEMFADIGQPGSFRIYHRPGKVHLGVVEGRGRPGDMGASNVSYIHSTVLYGLEQNDFQHPLSSLAIHVILLIVLIRKMLINNILVFLRPKLFQY